MNQDAGCGPAIGSLNREAQDMAEKREHERRLRASHQTLASREMTPAERGKRRLIGLACVFVPPQECKTPGSHDFYAAQITKYNGKSSEHGQVETVDLVTHGPNSTYFQHNVPFSETHRPGHWSYQGF